MKHIYLALFIITVFASKGLSQINFDAFISNDLETIKFVNLTKHNSSDPYMLFYWKLGDGVEMFAGKELDHVYEAPGVYEISLIGITKSGIRDTFIHSFKIPNDLKNISEESAKKKRNIAQALSNLKPESFEL